VVDFQIEASVFAAITPFRLADGVVDRVVIGHHQLPVMAGGIARQQCSQAAFDVGGFVVGGDHKQEMVAGGDRGGGPTTEAPGAYQPKKDDPVGMAFFPLTLVASSSPRARSAHA
jgi:hypothetical protein